MSSAPWADLLSRYRSTLEHRQLWRQASVLESVGAVRVCRDGRPLVNFSSNNYLGLTHHPRVVSAAVEACQTHGVGSGASPLVSGQSPLHDSLQRLIAAWKSTESAVLTPSGYQANLSVVQALHAAAGDTPPRFLIDKRCHASIVDAVRASGVTFRVYPHGGEEKLVRLLAGSGGGQPQVVITESVFSMDGDTADLEALCRLRREHGFLLVVDEAHACGVYGTAGAGLVNQLGLAGEVDVVVATLSKAVGGGGGAIATTSTIAGAITNAGRARTYSTSLTPPAVASAIAAIQVMQAEPQHQQRLHASTLYVRSRLAGLTRQEMSAAESPIIPLVVGSEAKSMELALRLETQGLFVAAIRPPTVPPGTSRLRLTISAAHSDEELDRLVQTVRKLWPLAVG